MQPLRFICFVSVFAASCATPNAGGSPQSADVETHTWGRRHTLARERCGWVEKSVLEDYGRVGVLRIGGSGCLVWFTGDGTAPYRELISGARPLRIVDLPNEHLPAVLIERTRWTGDSPDAQLLELELIRPLVGAQRIRLVGYSPTTTIVGADEPCGSVSLRAHLCAEALWTEERSCLRDKPGQLFRRWKPGELGAHLTQVERPACATTAGETWFEATVRAQVTQPLAPNASLVPPPPPGPPTAESSTLIGMFPSKAKDTLAFAAFEVRRSDLAGGLERDLDLYARAAKGDTWRRTFSVTLRRGAPVDGCRERAVLSDRGELSVVSCVDGKRIETVGFAAPRAVRTDPRESLIRTELQREPRACYPAQGRFVCLDEASDGSAVGWVVNPQAEAPRGIPAVRGLKLLDAPFFEGDRVRFVGRDLTSPGEPVRWVEQPLSVSPEDRTGQRLLESLIPAGGWSMGAWKLQSGAVFATRAVCSEWGAALPGAIVFPRKGKARPEVLRVDSGPALDLGRYLVIWAEVQVGGDGGGDEEPVRLPPGATFFEHTGNGSYVIHRLVSVDLKTRATRQLGWGTHSPRTAGARRVVVFAKALEPFDLHGQKVADSARHEVSTWDLPSGKTTLLGISAGPVRARVEGDEVWVRLQDQRGSRVLAVNGTTGAVRVVPGRADVEPAPVSFPLLTTGTTAPSAPRPDLWQTPAGEAILVGGAMRPKIPETGGCGNPDYLWFDGVFIADEGIFLWPDDLEVLDFKRPTR